PQEPQTRSVQPSTDIGAAPEEGEGENRLLLRFAMPRDPVMVANWVSYNVIDTERQDWRRGWTAPARFVEREGHARVPYDHKGGPYPLGQWVAEQRRAYTAGQMTGKRIERLEQFGIVWDPAGTAFQENLAAARACYNQHWTLCAPRTATALDRPVGQWLSNLRRPGALDTHPQRKAALEAIDKHWNPDWPADWQRHYAAAREMLREETDQTQLLPGVTVHGMDIGTWLARQRQPTVWHALASANCSPHSASNRSPHPRKDPPRPAKGPWRLRAGRCGPRPVQGPYRIPEGPQGPRRTAEGRHRGQARRMAVQHQTRRPTLTPEQLAQLARLGLEWAAQEG
ncbi:helicase associated domain-containing protein, partial [Streptomyces sp. NPDC005209]|uniref:helicase associated domain-containing protein n=1 Tax=Streptomyces sp. NPDC005209 TaxID=3156715 RepID=UPI0033A667AC